MRRVFSGRMAMLGLALAITAVGSHAQDQEERSQRAKQTQAGGPFISVHDINRADFPTNDGEVEPDRIGGQPTQGSTTSRLPAITNHGGPRMTTPTIYLIWYGNWNQSNHSDNGAGQTIIRDFAFGINNSPYFQINTTYNGPTGFTIQGAEYNYTPTGAGYSKSLSDSNILSIVTNSIGTSGGKLPRDTTGVYFLLTSSDVTASSGFCTQYCGWHTHASLSGSDIKYAFVGNANRCLSSCAAQTVSPNDNAGVDGMISVIAHELEEATTDPDLNAWYDKKGAENADKCAWTFGQNQTLLSNGSYANMSLPGLSVGSRNYLIQRNLSAADNKCYVNGVTKIQ